jgi:predicted GNAT family N-acyltransferase
VSSRLVLDPAYEELLALRAAVLRPGRPPESARFSGDDEPTTLHVGLEHAGRLVAVATASLRPPPEAAQDVLADTLDARGLAWRVRGVAVATELQGQGLGALLMRGLLELLAARDGPRGVFLHARAWVIGFYEQLGFQSVGDRFEVEGIGPHQVMVRRLEELNAAR